MAAIDDQPYILIVEDDDDIREAVIDVYQDSGYRVRGAIHGQAALDMLHDGSRLPSVILLDLMMPVMDGPSFRAAQLADPTLAALPVVVMSAAAHSGDKAKELAAAAFLRKPVPLGELIAIARRYLD